MAKILLIDDDEHVRKFLRSLLTKAGHVLDEASEGKAGIQAAIQGLPDLIITDLYMPGMEGMETILQLRRIAPQIPVMAVSGGGSSGQIDSLYDARNFGAVCTLPKPIVASDFLQAINEILNKYQASRSSTEL